MPISMVKRPRCRCGTRMAFVMHHPTQVLWQRQGAEDRWYVSADLVDLNYRKGHAAP